MGESFHDKSPALSRALQVLPHVARAAGGSRSCTSGLVIGQVLTSGTVKLTGRMCFVLRLSLATVPMMSSIAELMMKQINAKSSGPQAMWKLLSLQRKQPCNPENHQALANSAWAFATSAIRNE